MKKPILALCFACLVVGLAGAAAAQTTYDLASYFQITHGQWRIEEERDLGNSQAPVQRVAFAVQRQGTFVLRNSFYWNGKGWVPDTVEVMEVTPTHLIYYGEYDPVSGDYEIFTPALKIPRSLKLNQPFCHQGFLSTPKKTMAITAILSITADNITKVVKAGTFTKCIRFKGSISANEVIDSWSEVRAPGHGLVFGYDTILDETEPEASMVWSGRYERTDPKKP